MRLTALRLVAFYVSVAGCGFLAASCASTANAVEISQSIAAFFFLMAVGNSVLLALRGPGYVVYDEDPTHPIKYYLFSVIFLSAFFADTLRQEMFR
ncbi:hypothetical protein [Congregibacter litoralis]|uniref:Lipoprotein n=1 Tax=Congregibacter litoralis KT71 TaxID=314285 RepID=A4A8G3_9GAMM|nr:hypothetical protein [Congregibacter litoralis]EAQ97958.2 hypothetical protein KT71_15374 [Congregibacter litoralis KT71]